MAKRTVHSCDCCGNDCNVYPLKLSTNRWSLDVELCADCMRPFERLRSQWNWIDNVKILVSDVIRKVAEIIKSKSKSK